MQKRVTKKALLSLCLPPKSSFTSSKLHQDLQALIICLIIKLLPIHIAIDQQFYNIQFAYKIGDFGKIVIPKYHL